MTNEEFAALVASEEAKRDRCVDPVKRWKAIEAAIEWADAQQPVPRNSREGCLAAHRRRAEGGSSSDSD